MTTETTTITSERPDYAPVPQSALGPALNGQYMADIAEASRNAIDSTDLTRYFEKYPDNPWAAFRGGLEEVVANAAAPVIEKYTGVLAAADVFTESTTFQVLQSIRLDLGYGSWVHP